MSFLKSQEDSEFNSSKKELLRLNKQISDLTQVRHIWSDMKFQFN